MNTSAPHMYQAIATKYFGPTNVRSSRVKATAAAGSVTLEWDSALNVEQNHARAAEALANKFGWKGFWFGGALPGSGFAFVCSEGGGAYHFMTAGRH